MKNKKQAFTLAEVLLVLAIIGVIAAVTIPAIMQQSSEKKFSALAKKAQSTLQNAVNLKIATVPIGPGDVGTGLFQWLLDGEDDNTNTLKAAKINSTSTVLQLPDGIIIRQSSGNCSTASTRSKPLGCNTEIYIDLNGSDPPTKTTIDNATTKLSSTVFNDPKAYDVLVLWAINDGKVRPCSNTSLLVCKRPIKYLGITPH